MEFKKSTSKEIKDYEILVRRRTEIDYSSYCPQLNYQINSTSHELVENKMNDYVLNYVNSLPE